MKTPSRTFRVVGAATLLMSLVALLVAPVAAQPGIPGEPGGDMDFETAGSESFRAGVNTIYYPWVSNSNDFGLGAADTSISVQNLEDRDALITIYVGDGAGGFPAVMTAPLSRFASKTFTADDLEIAEGEGAPVAVSAYHLLPADSVEDFIETEVLLSHPDDLGLPDEEGREVSVCVVNEIVTEVEVDTETGVETEVTFAEPQGFRVAQPFTFEGVSYEPGDIYEDDFTSEDLQEILNNAQDGSGVLVNPFGGLNDDADCFDRETDGTLFDSVALGGIAKAAVGGATLPRTSSADTAVSGYNAISGYEVFRFDEWYLPIVQTNCGPGGCWDSVLRISNVGAINNAVTVRFFPADNAQGSLSTGFQINELVDGGDVWNITLSDHVPEGWIGSAHIVSDGATFALVDRFKVGTDMWLTNTGSSADFENLSQVEGSSGDYVLFAPHVLVDYFGWNTGINVANLVEQENHVSIQYFNLLGNQTEGLNRRIAAHGMTYFYDPSQASQDINNQDQTEDVTAGVVGSALIWSEHPVAAVVDATKYAQTDPNGGADVGHATSYSATANVFNWQAVPLAQKGDPIDGMGATSGINIMNPNDRPATANVYWVNQSGYQASNFGISSVTIPPYANGFVYSLTQKNLPNGFYGAAQVIADVPVVAVSANVDYQVDGDGSAIFNAYNPCGLYRSAGFTPLLDDDGEVVEDEDGDAVLVPECSFGDPFDTTGRSVTKTFLDTNGEPIPGVGFSIVGENPAFPYQRDGFSGLDGTATFNNVPAGEYELIVTSTPDDFLLPEVDEDDPEMFTVSQGEDVTLTNTLDFAQGFSKSVIVLGATELTPVSGVDVAVYADGGSTAGGDMVIGEVVFEGETGGNGIVSSGLPAGTYTLCIFDEDGEATAGGEDITPILPDEADFDGDNCEVFTIAVGDTEELVNPILFEGQDTASFVVSPENMQGFEERDGQTGEVDFAEGPGAPPAGEGSVQFTTADGGKATLVNDDFAGVDIVDLTALSYHTYQTDGSGTGEVLPAIKLPVLYNDGANFTTLVFEPVYSVGTQDVESGEWQFWDAFSPDARWWSTRDIGGGICAFTCYVTFEEIEAQIPDAFLIELLLETGSGSPGADGNVDLLTVGVNGVNYVYDFEPAPTP